MTQKFCERLSESALQTDSDTNLRRRSHRVISIRTSRGDFHVHIAMVTQGHGSAVTADVFIQPDESDGQSSATALNKQSELIAQSPSTEATVRRVRALIVKETRDDSDILETPADPLLTSYHEAPVPVVGVHIKHGL